MQIKYLKEFTTQIKALLLTKALAYTQSAFAQFLINIYFWRITGSISFLVLFNITFEVGHVFASWIAGKVCKEQNRFLPLRASMILQLVYLAFIIYLKADVVSYIIPIAILGGLAHGAYWFADDLLKLDLTNLENRLKFTAVQRILKDSIGSLIPLMASIIVATQLGTERAYASIFILAIIFSALVFISSFFISEKKRFISEKFSVVKASCELFKDQNIRLAVIGNGLSYVSDALPMLLGLLLFIKSGTELSLGGYQFITVIIAVATNYLLGKYFTRKNYRALLIYGGIINFVLVFILIISQSFGAILLYGLLKALFSFMNSPVYPLTIDAFNIHCRDQGECINKRAEYVFFQAFFSSLGKVISLVIFLILSYSLNPWLIGIVVVLFAFGDLISNVVMTRIKDGKYSVVDGLN